jgi:hypothetical protein
MTHFHEKKKKKKKLIINAKLSCSSPISFVLSLSLSIGSPRPRWEEEHLKKMTSFASL